MLRAVPPGAREAIALVFVFGLGAALRFHAIGVPTYWTDEFYSLQESNGYEMRASLGTPGVLQEPMPLLTEHAAARPIRELVAAVRTDDSAPLFFAVLHFWRRLVPDREAWTRGLAALFSLAALGLGWLVVRSRFGPGSALAAALLVALSTQQIRYAQEVRGYALATALVTLALLAVDRLERRASWGWAGILGVASLLAVLTHYDTVGALAGLGLYALLVLRGREQRAVLGAFAASLVAFAVTWGPILATHRFGTTTEWILDKAGPGHLSRTLVRLVALPAALLADNDPPRSVWLPAVGLGLWLLLALAFRRPAARIFVAVVVGTALILLATDLWLGTRQLDYPRYALFAGPALAAGIAALSGRRGRVAAFALAALLAFRVPLSYATGRLPWRDVAPVLAAKARPHEPLVVVGRGGSDLNALAVFQALRHYAWAGDRGFVLVETPADAALREALLVRDSAWIVSYKDARLGLLPPFRVLDELDTAPDMPRFWRVSFAVPLAGRP